VNAAAQAVSPGILAVRTFPYFANQPTFLFVVFVVVEQGNCPEIRLLALSINNNLCVLDHGAQTNIDFLF